METNRILLLGMTGMGNTALDTLCRIPSVKVVGVFTPKRESGPFPYYPCEPLQDMVRDNEIPLFEGLRLRAKETLERIAELSPDLIVVASFNQIVPREVIMTPRLGVVNIHPSLLPAYRGATPTVWAIINGEPETGVTAHFIENEEVDSGRIICQARLTINDDDTDGTLRRRLNELSRSVIIEAVRLVLNKAKEDFPPQDEARASWYPRRTEEDAEIDLSEAIVEIRRRIRAMTPYPGARLVYQGRIFPVAGAVSCDSADEGEPNTIVAKAGDGVVKFIITKEN